MAIQLIHPLEFAEVWQLFEVVEVVLLQVVGGQLQPPILEQVLHVFFR